MIDIDRRTMLGTTVVAGLAAAAPAWASAARPPSILVYDQRFAAARLEAERIRAAGGLALDPRERDLGLAWRDEIPLHLAKGPVLIGGITLWSDQFICQTFAREHGLSLTLGRPIDTAAQGGAKGLREWTIA